MLLGEDQRRTPCWPIGPFNIRLPFIHYRIEWPDYVQGLVMCAVDLAAIPLMTELLGMPFDVALAVIMMNGLLYLTHHLLGDPVVPGWITPAIPLMMAYCSSFPAGTERIHALISLQLMLGLLSIAIGIFGLAHRVMGAIPQAIKSGIIMGSGFAAIISVFEPKGRFDSFPITIGIAMSLVFYIMFSQHFARMRQRHPLFGLIGKLGVVPAILFAIIGAPLLGEASWPVIKWGLSAPNFGRLWREYSVFGLGFPPITMLLAAIPTVLATYIVVFGDVIKGQAILQEAERKRPEEAIDADPDRAHIIFGGRNVAMSMVGPDIAMCGPIWAAMHVIIAERYTQGRRAMKSIYGGVGSFRWGTNTGLLLMPIVSLVQPILAIALSFTLLIQGFVSVRIGVLEARSQMDLGIAGIVGAVLATRGATWAFACGVILCLLLFGRDFFRGGSDGTFARWPDRRDDHRDDKKNFR